MNYGVHDNLSRVKTVASNLVANGRNIAYEILSMSAERE